MAQVKKTFSLPYETLKMLEKIWLDRRLETQKGSISSVVSEAIQMLYYKEYMENQHGC